MTSRQRALEAISDAIDDFTAPEAIPEKAVENLQRVGLPIEDEPLKPSYVVTECEEEYPVWEALTGFRIEADPYNRDFYIHNDYAPGKPLNRAQFRTMLRYMQAAEDYMEEH